MAQTADPPHRVRDPEAPRELRAAAPGRMHSSGRPECHRAFLPAPAFRVKCRMARKKKRVPKRGKRSVGRCWTLAILAAAADPFPYLFFV